MICHDGIWWPDTDTVGREIIHNELYKLEHAVPLCRGLRTVVQAGGNVGLFPLQLVWHGFDRVLTFEPSAINYECLLKNTELEERITPFFGALGNSRDPVGFNPVWLQNCGVGRVSGPGDIPQYRIDDFNLDDCDMIQLDVEGYEYNVLEGAVETISRCKPIIMVEDRGHGGYKMGDLQKWIAENFNYEVEERVEYDVILKPRATLAL